MSECISVLCLVCLPVCLSIHALVNSNPTISPSMYHVIIVYCL